MSEAVDLTKVSSDALRAELTRRQQAAKAKGRPLRFATKEEWAAARAVELRAQLAQVRGGYHAGAAGLRKRGDQEEILQAEIQKFDRLTAKYRREGV